MKKKLISNSVEVLKESYKLGFKFRSIYHDLISNIVRKDNEELRTFERIYLFRTHQIQQECKKESPNYALINSALKDMKENNSQLRRFKKDILEAYEQTLSMQRELKTRSLQKYLETRLTKEEIAEIDEQAALEVKKLRDAKNNDQS